jgi:hypothetical protein
VTSEELLAAARRLVEHPDAGTAGVWPRAAALLARQALEQAMAGLWAGQPEAAGLSGGTMRSQLLCLTAYVDQDVATRAAYLSAALSRACHYHPYELVPTASELTRWLNDTADLVALLRSRADSRPISGAQLTLRLEALGTAPRQALSSALFQLAVEIPAAILARTLGVSTDVAVTWQRLSAFDWAPMLPKSAAGPGTNPFHHHTRPQASRDRLCPLPRHRATYSDNSNNQLCVRDYRRETRPRPQGHSVAATPRGVGRLEGRTTHADQTARRGTGHRAGRRGTGHRAGPRTRAAS